MKNKIVSILTGGGGPAEPVAERHPQSDPSEKLTIAVKQSVLTDGVKATAKGGEPAPVRVRRCRRCDWSVSVRSTLPNKTIYYRFVRGEILQRFIIVA